MSTVALTEAQASRLRLGQTVRLTPDASPGGRLIQAQSRGKLVALVRPEAEADGGTSLKPVRVFNLDQGV